MPALIEVTSLGASALQSVPEIKSQFSRHEELHRILSKCRPMLTNHLLSGPEVLYV